MKNELWFNFDPLFRLHDFDAFRKSSMGIKCDMKVVADCPYDSYGSHEVIGEKEKLS